MAYSTPPDTPSTIHIPISTNPISWGGILNTGLKPGVR